MAYLYQEIMNVPGLTGTWQERNRQLYQKLGAPLGSYKGNYQQNIWLLNQIRDNNYYKGGFPGEQKAQATQTTQPKVEAPLSDQYAQTGVQAGEAANVPQFQEVLPYEQAWGGIQPQATQAAASQIDPEIMRQYRSGNRDIMNQLASSGGQRFGRGLQQAGEFKASTERNRQAQLQDWLNQFEQGYKSLFYEPSQQAWNRAITSGLTPDESLKNMPTFDEAYTKYEDAYGVGSTPSPLYG